MNDLRRSAVLETLCRHKAELAERYALTALGVFGSVARDEAGEDSDLDIVFETTTPNLFRAVHMKKDLEAIFHRRVDVLRWRENMNPRLKARVAGEVVYV